MVLKDITSKTIWEEFLTKAYTGWYPFFQSWDWGDVQIVLGFRVFRWGIYTKDVLVGVVQLIEVEAKRGHYLHVRHGPVLNDFVNDFPELLENIRCFAFERGVSFLRMSPFLEKAHEALSVFDESGFRDAPIHNMDAEVCWVLDIKKPEDDLLKDMRKSHRYLIKKAKSMSIEVIKSNNIKDIDLFLPLYRQLSVSKHFVAHKGVAEEFRIFAKDDESVLFLAKYEEKIIAGCLIDFVGNMAIYRHGASDDGYRHIPASYLLQWEAICDARKRGKSVYNFWGITSTEDKKHPWFGLSQFKMGFGGEKKEFVHAMDLPLSTLYWKSYLIDTMTKWRKGY